MPKISILMAVYNPNLDYFQECLNAIEQQTFQDFEVIIVDDGSLNCEIEPIVKKYNINYKILKNQLNVGLAKSLNRGLKECHGTYIARIDDDDIMYKDRLSIQYDFALTHDGFIFGNVDLINSNGDIINSNKSTIKNDIKTYLKKSGNCLTHSTLFVKKQILDEIGGYDERFIYAQDYALYMSIIDEYEFHFIDKKIVKYRLPNGRISNMKRILSLLSCYGAAVNYFSSNKKLKNYYYFFRRSFGVIKLLFKYIIAQ